MHTWQLQEAKARFSEVVKLANFSPQVITVRGHEEVVIISRKTYSEFANEKQDIVSFIQNSPLKSEDLDFMRDKSLFRDVSL